MSDPAPTPGAKAQVTVCFHAPPEPAPLASADFASEIVVLGPPAADVDEAVHLRTAVVGARWPLVLLVDCDEVVTPALAAEIGAIAARAPAAASYRVRRRGHYLGRTIDCPDWQGLGPIRVFDRRLAIGGGSDHGAPAASSVGGELRSEILATRTLSLSAMLQDIARASREVGGGRPSAGELVLAPVIELWRSFWRRGGFGGGMAGFFLATMDSCYVLVRLARRYARATGAESGVAASRA